MKLAFKICLSIAVALALPVMAISTYHAMISEMPTLKVMTIVAWHLIENPWNGSVLLIVLSLIVFDSMNPERTVEIYGGTDGIRTTDKFMVPKLLLYPLAVVVVCILLIVMTNEGVKSQLVRHL